MSEEKMPTKTSDRLSEYIGQRLKEHRIQPDDACWQEIESRMQPSRRLYVLKIAMATAVAILAFLLLISLPWRNEEESIFPEIADITVIEKNIPAESGIEEPFTPDIILPNQHVAVKSNKKGVYTTPGVQQVEINAKEEVQEDKEEVEKEESKSLEKQKEETPADNHIKQPYYSSLDNRNNLTGLTKRQNSWIVAAAVGTGTGVNSFLYKGEMDYNDGEWMIPDPGHPGWIGNGNQDDNYYNNSDKLEEYSDIDYRMPVSFGITLRKKINKYVAIESGLIYTYLSTRFKENGFKARYEAKSGLHYLGIPVNVVGNIYTNSSWNIYLSGGFMAEKGLSSVITIDKIVANEVTSSTEKSSIKGIQWSVNGAVGVSYRLFSEWSIYAEPRISYYFDTNQPLSIRTDKPVTFGIGGGIRYEF